MSWPGLPINAAGLIPNILFSQGNKFLGNILTEALNEMAINQL